KTMQMTIQQPATILPANERGAISPYPVVVIVTIAHHMPSPIPLIGSSENSSALILRSLNQKSVPTTARMKTKLHTAIKNLVLKNGLMRSHNEGSSTRDMIARLV